LDRKKKKKKIINMIQVNYISSFSPARSKNHIGEKRKVEKRYQSIVRVNIVMGGGAKKQ